MIVLLAFRWYLLAWQDTHTQTHTHTQAHTHIHNILKISSAVAFYSYMLLREKKQKGTDFSEFLHLPPFLHSRSARCDHQPGCPRALRT
jgi:hypothetical protein